MAELSGSRLHIWASGTSPPGPVPLSGPRGVAELASRLFAAEAMAGGRGRTRSEPFSLQWFLDLETLRHNRHGRWIPGLLEFAKHSGETLLALDDGVGTDAVQYARHGADVIVCSPLSERLTLAQRNFELRSLSGRFLHALPNALPLPSGIIDVVCLLTPADGAAGEGVVEEIYRVLKPGGKVLALLPARFDVDYWCRAWLPWGRPPREPSFSARSLRRLFQRFTEHSVYQRHLRRSEVPHLARWLPLPLLERLAGRLLLLKAFKPLSAALPPAAAA